MSKIILGTRGSALALWQAEHVSAELQRIGLEAEIKIIKTKGDQIQHLSFDKIEGKGFFTKEIEDALLAGEIDLAVHSLKDLPTTPVEGLRIAALTYREDPADWLIIRPEAIEQEQIFKLKAKAVVGTSSARRKAQLLHFRPDIELQDLRGNVPTRLDRLRQGQYDAIMLAGAGLKRLNLDLSEFVVWEMSPREFVPAPAQGVVALQIRREDRLLYEQLQELHHKEVGQRTNIERKVLQLMEGGCQMPLGVYCERDALGQYRVWASIASAWNAPLHQIYMASVILKDFPEKIAQALREQTQEA